MALAILASSSATPLGVLLICCNRNPSYCKMCLHSWMIWPNPDSSCSTEWPASYTTLASISDIDFYYPMGGLFSLNHTAAFRNAMGWASLGEQRPLIFLDGSSLYPLVHLATSCPRQWHSYPGRQLQLRNKVLLKYTNHPLLTNERNNNTPLLS